MDLNINLNVNFPQFDVIASELIKILNDKFDEIKKEGKDEVPDFGPGICPEDYK